jgi:branched-chain amino acid transport system substrate-binding protein
VHFSADTSTETNRGNKGDELIHKRVLAVAAVAVLTSAACGSSTKSGSNTTAAGGATTAAATKPTGTPIVLGSVSSLTGVDIFPESPNAAKAVFDEVNKAGGVNGHPIEYTIVDDGDTAEGAASAAKRLVEENKIFAMVGGGSISDCTTNAKYYKEQNILMLGGVSACGPDAGNVASMNTGPFLGTMMTFSYMIEKMGVKNLCFSGLNVGLTPLFRDTFIPLWEKTTGYKLKELITSEPNEDLTGAVTKAKQDGCDGVLLAYTEPNYIAYAQIASSQGVLDGKIKFGMLTSGYSTNVLKKLGKNGEGWISNSEFLPWTEEASVSKDLADFKRVLKEGGLEETSFAQGGYLAAKAMVEVLKTVQGDYTRESVSTALKAMNYKTDLLGNPATWVPYEGANQLNTTSKIVQIKDGKFVTVSDWLQWPPKK